ncbi:hypothetical protein BU23DRAFT_200512 [Bimuria novae-zelandiae CBS 107.79]|uniref:Uncharacterized protein n=1 Tax=Bimuria novae-zelandiae CBS 107.79 TaxID=1447943 RepID=A0A6A5VCA5_9PLEO|nr:hypothetical protein BU23DRAFT_200512 [Bimuria novae-zelandiae CBS 107.79]
MASCQHNVNQCSLADARCIPCDQNISRKPGLRQYKCSECGYIWCTQCWKKEEVELQVKTSSNIRHRKPWKFGACA